MQYGVSRIADDCIVCGTCSLKRRHSDGITQNTVYTGNCYLLPV